MGCCQSSHLEDDSPSPARIAAPAPAPGASSPPLLPISPPPPSNARALPAADQTSLSSGDSRRGSYDGPSQQLTGVHRPNKPIRKPSPLRYSPTDVSHLTRPWTRAQLDSERAAFFDTRIAGRPEIWNALRLVCDMLQRGEVTEAQGILDAVDVSCPNARVAVGRGRDRARGGLYDERGELYVIPAWVLTDPQDIVEADTEKLGVNDHTDDDEDQTGHHGDRTADLRREEKGKGRAADLGEIVQLRARLSDHSTDVTVSVGKQEKVAAIVRKIQEQIGAKRLRLVYLGHVLHETKTLNEQNYRSGDVVNAYVFEGSEDTLLKQRTK